ncbi:MAG: DUF1330 domain-containing protein [Pseudomonadota bacterium]
MFKPTLLAAAIAAGIFANHAAEAGDLLTRAPTPADTDDVYFLAQLVVEDFETFQAEYQPGTLMKLNETNAELLAATPMAQAIEGEWQSNWTVLLRFENQLDFETFYEEQGYREKLIPVRQQVTSLNNIVLLPAFDPAQFGG